MLACAEEAAAQAPAAAPLQLERGRFTIAYYPAEARLARALLEQAVATDTFPGLPRPAARVHVALAPNDALFREWVGPYAPEWGAAIAFPREQRIIMQGRGAGSDAGDPREVFRHELAHLALQERLGDLTPRWFDEGYASYAAGELQREDVLAANFALVVRGMPTLEELDQLFAGSGNDAQAAYALSYRAVAELAALDTTRGLAPLVESWRETQSLDRAIRATYGITLDGFEDRWRANTRRRYGMLALVSNVALAGTATMLLVLPLYLARRRRMRRRMEALVEADAATEKAEQEGTLAELLRPSPTTTVETTGGDEVAERGDERPRGGPREAP